MKPVPVSLFFVELIEILHGGPVRCNPVRICHGFRAAPGGRAVPGQFSADPRQGRLNRSATYTAHNKKRSGKYPLRFHGRFLVG
jgi:hypothetical protein